MDYPLVGVATTAGDIEVHPPASNFLRNSSTVALFSSVWYCV
jgi:hypothetical protein